MTKRGQFIVVEGLEGAGKSTALQSLHDYLAQRVSEVIITREPGGTALGETLRNVVKACGDSSPIVSMSELLIMYAARVQHVEQVIKPALERGVWVLCDRFELSTYAYQGAGRGIAVTDIDTLSALCLRGFSPDLTLFLDINPELGLKRIQQRGARDRFEQEPLPFFMAINQCYQQHLVHNPTIKRIDASQPLAQVQAALYETLGLFIKDLL